MIRSFILAIAILLVLCAAPASAAEYSGFWGGFKHFWGNLFGSVSGVVGVALLTGAIGIFIITRGKWVK